MPFHLVCCWYATWNGLFSWQTSATGGENITADGVSLENNCAACTNISLLLNFKSLRILEIAVKLAHSRILGAFSTEPHIHMISDDGT